MKTLFLLAFALFPFSPVSFATAPSHPVLRAHLLSLLQENGDQAIKPESERAAIHEQHRSKLRTILQTQGWPGRDAVGEDGSRAALNLLQEECTDSELLKRAIPLLHAAVQRRVAALSDLARLIDAARLGEGRMQVYGTQYRAALDGRPIRFPVEDLEHVDTRRRLVGLPSLRAQEEAMGLIAPRSGIARSQPSSTKEYWQTRLQTAPGLNSVWYPTLRMIYVHSRDDPRAPAGQRYALPGLDTKTLPISPNGR